jgi:hypothetical protein
MPNRRGTRSLRNRELYEELRNEGASEQKATRISNAVERNSPPAVARLVGAGDYEGWTVAHLRGRAKQLGLTGYSGKRKAEIIRLLRTY